MTVTKRVVLVGASGMVGGYALRYLLEDAAVGRVTSVGRRNLGASHPKLTEILHSDFANCSPLAEALRGHDAAVYCPGYPAFRVLFPNQVIRADDLARTMVDVAVQGPGEGRALVLENRDIRHLALRSREHD